jgi:hypothetical protein
MILHINNFINTFKNQHSWYKILNDERETPFIFFKKKNGEIDYYDESSTYPTPLTRELKLTDKEIKKGRFYVSKFIYGDFKNFNQYFYKTKSYADLHQEIMNDLKNHLISMYKN